MTELVVTALIIAASALAILAVPLACDGGSSGESSEQEGPIYGYQPVAPPTTDSVWPTLNPFVEFLGLLGHDAQLATGNPRDFPMAEVQVDYWPTGE